jgi:ABC-type glycerol-3-phosphate transport system permease component
MRSFFREVPDELINAARIDGAGEFRTFVNIIMPLTIPAVGSLLVFEFMWGWNDFLLPLLMIYKDSLRTLPLGLMYYKSKYTTNYSLAAAGVIITSLPIIIIYLIFQKNFIQGMTLGAVKG